MSTRPISGHTVDLAAIPVENPSHLSSPKITEKAVVFGGLGVSLLLWCGFLICCSHVLLPFSPIRGFPT
ncbi:hypothetical protein HanHA300_Chr13g0501361 [Helianthus annuus]|nr:hypothetical protein HanHA300_Chr13g0501361 [Helianthus annuus]